jgi:hypothetical protein
LIIWTFILCLKYLPGSPEASPLAMFSVWREQTCRPQPASPVATLEVVLAASRVAWLQPSRIVIALRWSARTRLTPNAMLGKCGSRNPVLSVLWSV